MDYWELVHDKLLQKNVGSWYLIGVWEHHDEWKHLRTCEHCWLLYLATLIVINSTFRTKILWPLMCFSLMMLSPSWAVDFSEPGTGVIFGEMNGWSLLASVNSLMGRSRLLFKLLKGQQENVSPDSSPRPVFPERGLTGPAERPGMLPSERYRRGRKEDVPKEQLQYHWMRATRPISGSPKTEQLGEMIQVVALYVRVRQRAGGSSGSL